MYEYFYQENPPPSVEIVLPPMQDPTDTEFPPDSMIDNPLSPPPSVRGSHENNDALPRVSRDEPPPSDGADAAARIMNPSGQ